MRDSKNPVEMIGGVPVVAAPAGIGAATAEQLRCPDPATALATASCDRAPGSAS
jgi:hypothetical protein